MVLKFYSLKKRELYHYDRRYRTRFKDTYLSNIRNKWSQKNLKYKRDKNYDMFCSKRNNKFASFNDISDKKELNQSFISSAAQKLKQKDFNNDNKTNFYKRSKIKFIKLFYFKHDEFGFFINFLFDFYFPNYSNNSWVLSYESVGNLFKINSLDFNYFKNFQKKWFKWFKRYNFLFHNIQILLQSFIFSLKRNKLKFNNFWFSSLEFIQFHWFFHKKTSSFTKLEKILKNDESLDLTFLDANNIKKSYNFLFQEVNKKLQKHRKFSLLNKNELKLSHTVSESQKRFHRFANLKKKTNKKFKLNFLYKGSNLLRANSFYSSKLKTFTKKKKFIIKNILQKNNFYYESKNKELFYFLNNGLSTNQEEEYVHNYLIDGDFDNIFFDSQTEKSYSLEAIALYDDSEDALIRTTRKNYRPYSRKKLRPKNVTVKSGTVKPFFLKKDDLDLFKKISLKKSINFLPYKLKLNYFSFTPNLQTFYDNSAYFSFETSFNYSAGLTTNDKPDFFWDDWESSFLQQQNGAKSSYFDTLHDEELGLHRVQSTNLPLIAVSSSWVHQSPSIRDRIFKEKNRFNLRALRAFKEAKKKEKYREKTYDLYDLRNIMSYRAAINKYRLERSPLTFVNWANKDENARFINSVYHRTKRKINILLRRRFFEPNWAFLDKDESLVNTLGYNASVKKSLFTETEKEDPDYLTELVDFADGPSQDALSDGVTTDEFLWEQNVDSMKRSPTTTNRYYNTNILFDWYSLSRFNPKFGGHNHRLFDEFLGDQTFYTRRYFAIPQAKDKNQEIDTTRLYFQYKLRFFAPLDVETTLSEKNYSIINVFTPRALKGNRNIKRQRVYNYFDEAFDDNLLTFNFLTIDKFLNMSHERDYETYSEDEYCRYYDADSDTLTFEDIEEFDQNTSQKYKPWRRQNPIPPSKGYLNMQLYHYLPTSTSWLPQSEIAKEEKDFFYTPNSRASSYINDISNNSYFFARFFERSDLSLASPGFFFSVFLGFLFSFCSVMYYNPVMEFYEFYFNKYSNFYERDNFSIFSYPSLGSHYLDLTWFDNKKINLNANGYNLLENISYPYYVRYNSANHYGLTHQNNILDYQFTSTLKKFHPNLFALRFDVSSQLGLINETPYAEKTKADFMDTSLYKHLKEDQIYVYINRAVGRPVGWFFSLMPTRPVLSLDVGNREYTSQFTMSNAFSWLEADSALFRGPLNLELPIAVSEYSDLYLDSDHRIKTKAYTIAYKHPSNLLYKGVHKYDNYSTEDSQIALSTNSVDFNLSENEQEANEQLFIIKQKGGYPAPAKRVFKVYPVSPMDLYHSFGAFETEETELDSPYEIDSGYDDSEHNRVPETIFSNTLFYPTKIDTVSVDNFGFFDKYQINYYPDELNKYIYINASSNPTDVPARYGRDSKNAYVYHNNWSVAKGYHYPSEEFIPFFDLNRPRFHASSFDKFYETGKFKYIQGRAQSPVYDMFAGDELSIDFYTHQKRAKRQANSLSLFGDNLDDDERFYVLIDIAIEKKTKQLQDFKDALERDGPPEIDEEAELKKLERLALKTDAQNKINDLLAKPAKLTAGGKIKRPPPSTGRQLAALQLIVSENTDKPEITEESILNELNTLKKRLSDRNEENALLLSLENVDVDLDDFRYETGIQNIKQFFDEYYDYEQAFRQYKLAARPFIHKAVNPYFFSSWDLQNIFSYNKNLFPRLQMFSNLPYISQYSVLADFSSKAKLAKPYSLLVNNNFLTQDDLNGYHWFPTVLRDELGDYIPTKSKSDAFRGSLKKWRTYFGYFHSLMKGTPIEVSSTRADKSLISKIAQTNLTTETSSSYLRYILLINRLTGYNQLFTAPANLFSNFVLDNSTFVPRTGFSETIFRSPVFFKKNFLVSFPTLWETHNNSLWLKNFSDIVRNPNPVLSDFTPYENNSKLHSYLGFWTEFLEPMSFKFYVKLKILISNINVGLILFVLGLFYLFHDSYFNKLYLYKYNLLKLTNEINLTQLKSDLNVNEPLLSINDRNFKFNIKFKTDSNTRYSFLTPENPFELSRMSPLGKIHKRKNRLSVLKALSIKKNISSFTQDSFDFKKVKNFSNKSIKMNKSWEPLLSVNYSFLWNIPTFTNNLHIYKSQRDLKKKLTFLTKYNTRKLSKSLTFDKTNLNYNFLNLSGLSRYLFTDKSSFLVREYSNDTLLLSKSYKESLNLKSPRNQFNYPAVEEYSPRLNYTEEQIKAGLFMEDTFKHLDSTDRLDLEYSRYFDKHDEELYSEDEEDKVIEDNNFDYYFKNRVKTFSRRKLKNKYRYRTKSNSKLLRRLTWSKLRFKERKNNQIFNDIQLTQTVNPLILKDFLNTETKLGYSNVVLNSDLKPFLQETHDFTVDALNEFKALNLQFFDKTLAYSYEIDLDLTSNTGYITELDDMSEDFDYEVFDEEHDDQQFSPYSDTDSGDTVETLFEELVLKLTSDDELIEISVNSIVSDLFKNRLKNIKKLGSNSSILSYNLSENYKASINLSGYQNWRTLSPNSYLLDTPKFETSVSRDSFVDDQVTETYYFGLTSHGLPNNYLSIALTPYGLPLFFKRLSNYLKDFSDLLAEDVRFSKKILFDEDMENDYRRPRPRAVMRKVLKQKVRKFNGRRISRRDLPNVRKYFAERQKNSTFLSPLIDEKQALFQLYDSHAGDFFYNNLHSYVSEDYFNIAVEHTIGDPKIETNLYAYEYHEDEDDYFYQLPDYSGMYYKWRYCSLLFLKLLSQRPTEFKATQLIKVDTRHNKLNQYSTLLFSEDLNYSFFDNDNFINEWVASFMLSLTPTTYSDLLEFAQDSHIYDYLDDDEDSELTVALFEEDYDDEDQDDDEDEINEFENLNTSLYIDTIPEFVFDIALYNISPSDFTVDSERWSLNPYTSRSITTTIGLISDHYNKEKMKRKLDSFVNKTISSVPYTNYTVIDNAFSLIAKHYLKPPISLGEAYLSVGPTVIAGVSSDRGVPFKLNYHLELKEVSASLRSETRRKILEYRNLLRNKNELHYTGPLRCNSNIVTLQDIYEFLQTQRSPLVRGLSWSFWFPFSDVDEQHLNVLREDEDASFSEGSFYLSKRLKDKQNLQERFIPVRFAVLSALYFSEYNYQYKSFF